MEGDTEELQSYEVERIVTKRYRKVAGKLVLE